MDQSWGLNWISGFQEVGGKGPKFDPLSPNPLALKPQTLNTNPKTPKPKVLNLNPKPQTPISQPRDTWSLSGVHEPEALNLRSLNNYHGRGPILSYGRSRKSWVPNFGVLRIRILLFRVLS